MRRTHSHVRVLVVAAAREPAIASRRRPPPGPSRSRGDAPVGPREPCPCGSGRRYKNCHGDAGGAVLTLERRPFAGLPGEPEWVALREVVPAATFGATTRDGREVTVATVLPMAWPAMVRPDGSVLLGLQGKARSGDLSRELAATLEQALAAAPGSSIVPTGLPESGPRLQDLLTDDPIEVTVHPGFDFWLTGMGDVEEAAAALGGDVRASMERANAAVVPTARLTSVPAAYWCRMPERNHLRWVLPHDEDPALDALARLFVEDGLTLGEGTRYVGSFRAHGLLVPVWDLTPSVAADDLEEPVAALSGRIADAVAAGEPLDEEAQRARRALAGRQLTVR